MLRTKGKLYLIQGLSRRLDRPSARTSPSAQQPILEGFAEYKSDKLMGSAVKNLEHAVACWNLVEELSKDGDPADLRKVLEAARPIARFKKKASPQDFHVLADAVAAMQGGKEKG